MQHYGLIGKPLGHSFSANYFNRKFADEQLEAEYSLYELERIDSLPALLDTQSFCGLNVTIPYKTAVIPYLDELSEEAGAIGAVNVVAFTADGRLIGYNTDVIGFMDSIRPALRSTDSKALVLGTGGAAKACYYGLKKLGLTPTMVSRNPGGNAIGYAEANERIAETDVIVNCTPLGMHPDVTSCPDIAYERLTERQLLFDCVYNPAVTRFLQQGVDRGCRTLSGKGMLTGQAEAAWRIWEMEN